jgi:hypothetical protein
MMRGHPVPVGVGDLVVYPGEWTPGCPVHQGSGLPAEPEPPVFALVRFRRLRPGHHRQGRPSDPGRDLGVRVSAPSAFAWLLSVGSLAQAVLRAVRPPSPRSRPPRRDLGTTGLPDQATGPAGRRRPAHARPLLSRQGPRRVSTGQGRVSPGQVRTGQYATRADEVSVGLLACAAWPSPRATGGRRRRSSPRTSRWTAGACG